MKFYDSKKKAIIEEFSQATSMRSKTCECIFDVLSLDDIKKMSLHTQSVFNCNQYVV